jgi:hypothetical protein
VRFISSSMTQSRPSKDSFVDRLVSHVFRYLFIVLPDPSVAVQAARALDGHAFDKRHTFTVRTFDEVEALQHLDETFKEPTREPFQDREHLRAWLADPLSRDQLLLYRGDDVQIGWFNRTGSVEVAHERKVSSLPGRHGFAEPHTQVLTPLA